MFKLLHILLTRILASVYTRINRFAFLGQLFDKDDDDDDDASCSSSKNILKLIFL